jgi:hypothetical protein
MSLIFDGGPTQFSMGISNLLLSYGIQASFFIEADVFFRDVNHETLRELYQVGHSISLTAVSNPEHFTLTNSQVKREVERGFSLINSAVGHRPKFFMATNRLHTDSSLSIVEDFGLTNIYPGIIYDSGTEVDSVQPVVSLTEPRRLFRNYIFLHHESPTVFEDLQLQIMEALNDGYIIVSLETCVGPKTESSESSSSSSGSSSDDENIGSGDGNRITVKRSAVSIPEGTTGHFTSLVA